MLHVENMYYTFDRVRIDVASDATTASHSNVGTNWKTLGPVMPYPLVLEVKAKTDYFEKREGFNILGLLMNPMILMSVVSLLMIFVLPKVMSSIDPETLKELSAPSQQPMELEGVSEKLANMMTGSKPKASSSS
ncbi:hypothetical protein SmJEL517_g02682 [Synchytrium microbalum]|uniref:ER membrane protein complex subunit 7 beta-sandwich domain-containing protein n=1 Tax=Synchytrium microbalum TaxID=1806994 RepID=A0A507C6B3_9FUNG|nr:uncharacterized protein SmJEL517_g02682 [Synchytrium microbalum]TPX34649.1 hypothetical protein SmJEL517_g02682 [Synchytrium microbalum]